MRGRARTAFFGVFAAQAILACSLITDYSLEKKNAVTPPAEADPRDDVAPADATSTEDVASIVDADPGPVCTAKPCVTQIAAATYNTCARLDDGVVKCWGWNNTGVVGAAQRDANFPTPQAVALDGPADEVVLGGWPEEDSIACARRGTIVDCWGTDYDSMLGRGATGTGADFNPVPAPVSGLTGATGGIAIGGIRVCARVGDTLMCWSDDYTASKSGNKVIQTTATAFASPRPVKQIVGGRSHHCALFDNDEVGCVGYQQWYGPLWNTTGYERGPFSPTLQLVGGVTGIAQIASISNHTCALKKTGVVLCWGRNRRGELGRGSISDVEMTPAPVTLPRPAKYVGTGAKHTCVILDDDSVWCWGANTAHWRNGDATKPKVVTGQIGTPPDAGIDEVSASPRMIEGLPAGVKRAVVGGYAHTCVLMQDGSVHCFGRNNHGQLGLGTVDGGPAVDTKAHPTPTRVVF
jgi:alpha-tubulin suppressor-like RCC1 family protein